MSISGTALVTGGSQRMGAAMARFLAARGINMAIHYNSSRASADELVDELRNTGVKAVALQADLLDRNQTAALVPAAIDALGGPLTVLINNASTFENDTIETATWESWDRHIGSNLRAPFELIQAFAAQVPKGARDESGEPVARSCIVNMVDRRVRKLTPQFSTYTIAKMGLWALTQTAAKGLAPDIRVNAIGPGPTIVGTRQTMEHFNAQRAATILERGSNPDEVCAALGYFLDAPGVTGQLLGVDGGQHLAWRTPDVLGVE